MCNSAPGVVYSRGFLEQLKPYLPVCWPGNGSEMRGLSGCVSVMGLKCTAAKQVSLSIIVQYTFDSPNCQRRSLNRRKSEKTVFPLCVREYIHRLLKMAE